jgi:two-component system response regulator
MTQGKDWIPVLVADDNTDDCRLLKRAFQEAGISNRLDFVRDGQSLLDTLAAAASPRLLPGLILLDLNMPLLSGKEALKSIRADERFKHIPVLVLSTSGHEQDVMESYALGANSVIVKPMSYQEFVDLVLMLKKYWLEKVELPLQFARDTA